MSILVTGGAGYIGSHMVHELDDAGEGVVVLDNLSAGFDWAVAKGVPLIVGDTGDQNLVAQIIREHNVNSVVHFAAWLVVPDSVKDPLGFGYGHGFSVREVVEMVKRVTGVDFKVEIAPRRPGDPAQIVAASDRSRAMLGWTPQYDDLATIIAHALAWEQKLRKAGAGAL
jgi:UDP-glucose 4-epimerase